jgi:hypothetical protein
MAMDDRGMRTTEWPTAGAPDRVRASFLAHEIDADEATRRLLTLSKLQRARETAPRPS